MKPMYRMASYLAIAFVLCIAGYGVFCLVFPQQVKRDDGSVLLYELMQDNLGRHHDTIIAKLNQQSLYHRLSAMDTLAILAKSNNQFMRIISIHALVELIDLRKLPSNDNDNRVISPVTALVRVKALRDFYDHDYYKNFFVTLFVDGTRYDLFIDDNVDAQARFVEVFSTWWPAARQRYIDNDEKYWR